MLRTYSILILVAAPLLLAADALSLAANWPRIYANIQVSEGGARYTDDRRDPGGPTKYGVTLAAVRRHLNPNATAADVRNLTEAQARAIYEPQYWRHPCVRGPDLPAGIDYSVADFAVNSGQRRAGAQLRRMLGQADESCLVTDAMIADLRALSDAQQRHFIIVYNAQRLAFLQHLRHFDTFGRGWTRRVDSVRAISVRMATPGVRAGAADMRPLFGVGRVKAYDPDDQQEETSPR